MKNQFDPQELERTDKHQAAFHEAGHCTILNHYRIQWSAHIRRELDPTVENRSWTGQTVYSRDLSIFRRAVLGWAGLIGETFTGICGEWQRDDVAYLYFDADICELSTTDQNAIRSYPNQFRSFRQATEIILSRRDRLQAIASELIMHLNAAR